jgi:hypothetical protein
MSPERYVEILAELKPTFIHHPRANELIAGLLSELGCDIQTTYFDVPRLRTMAHGEYLKAGLAYQFHAHRDTFLRSPPAAQLVAAGLRDRVGGLDGVPSAVLPHAGAEQLRRLRLRGVERTGRQQAAKQVKKETRKQPQAEEPLELDPDIRVVTPPGATAAFSAAQLHSTVPTTTSRTRFSIDFRTVNLDDLVEGVAAPNVDSECTGHDASRLPASQRP